MLNGNNNQEKNDKILPSEAVFVFLLLSSDP